MEQQFGVVLEQEDNSPVHALGSLHKTPGGDLYRYVRAQAAKTIGLFYGIDETFEVSATAVVTTETHPLVGVPARTSGAVASGYTYKHFWIQTAGNFAKVVANAAVADNAALYACAVAGKVDDGDGGGQLLRGAKFTTATGGGADTTAFAANELKLNAA